MEKQKFIVVGASGNMGQLLIEKATAEGHHVIGAIVGPKDETNHVHSGPGGVGVLDCKKINEFDWRGFRNLWKGNQLPIILDATSETFVINNWVKYFRPIELPVIFITTGIKKDDIIGNKASVFIASPNANPELASVLSEYSKLKTGEFIQTDPDKTIYYGISESHQGPDLELGILGKKNPSSTARDADYYLTQAGFENRYFESIRDKEKQLAMGIRPEYLSGHAWHTYHFMSKDVKFVNSVYPIFSLLMSKIQNEYEGYQMTNSNEFCRIANEDESLEFIFRYDTHNIWFSHNVNGRNPYVSGLFSSRVLGSFVKKLQTKEVFNMFDFL